MVDGTHHKSKNVTAEPERPCSVSIWIYPIETPHTAYIKTHSAQKLTHYRTITAHSTQHTEQPLHPVHHFTRLLRKKTWTKHRRFKKASLASDSRKPYFIHQLSCVIPFLIVLQSSDTLSSRHQNTSPHQIVTSFESQIPAPPPAIADPSPTPQSKPFIQASPSTDPKT